MLQNIYNQNEKTFAICPSHQVGITVIPAGFQPRLQIHCECANLESAVVFALVYAPENPGKVEIDDNLQGEQNLLSNAPKTQCCNENSQAGMKLPLFSQALGVNRITASFQA